MKFSFKSVFLRKMWLYILVEQERDVILRLNLVLEMSLETWANSQVWYTVCSREVVWPLVHKRAHRQWIFSQATSTLCFSFGSEQKIILGIGQLYGVRASGLDNAQLSSMIYCAFFLPPVFEGGAVFYRTEIDIKIRRRACGFQNLVGTSVYGGRNLPLWLE